MKCAEKVADRGARIGVCLLCLLFLCAACTVQTEDIVACYGMRAVLSGHLRPAAYAQGAGRFTGCGRATARYAECAGRPTENRNKVQRQGARSAFVVPEKPLT